MTAGGKDRGQKMLTAATSFGHVLFLNFEFAIRNSPSPNP
jgi:hypothetical protein